jgi:outer membrane murein-binding lipoprotein Lpp
MASRNITSINDKIDAIKGKRLEYPAAVAAGSRRYGSAVAGSRSDATMTDLGAVVEQLVAQETDLAAQLEQTRKRLHAAKTELISMLQRIGT